MIKNCSLDSYQVPPHQDGNHSNFNSSSWNSFQRRCTTVTHNPLSLTDMDGHPIRNGLKLAKWDRRVTILLLESGSRQFVGQRVPALDLLAFVLQAVNPVLQGVPLWLTSQRHTPCVTHSKGDLGSNITMSLWDTLRVLWLLDKGNTSRAYVKPHNRASILEGIPGCTLFFEAKTP